MDDLISRKAAIEALGEEPLRWNNTITEGQEWNDWKYHVNAIKSVPNVPAVPLDKLCEWLADNYEPPANVSNGKALDDHEFCVTLWRYALEKLMEEQDAADRC